MKIRLAAIGLSLVLALGFAAAFLFPVLIPGPTEDAEAPPSPIAIADPTITAELTSYFDALDALRLCDHSDEGEKCAIPNAAEEIGGYPTAVLAPIIESYLSVDEPLSASTTDFVAFESTVAGDSAVLVLEVAGTWTPVDASLGGSASTEIRRITLSPADPASEGGSGWIVTADEPLPDSYLHGRA